MVDYSKQGKRNKASGADFERRVRADLESKGWIVNKWQNNIEFDEEEMDFNASGCVRKEACCSYHNKQGNFVYKEGKCVPAKPGRFRMMQTGFPDFIAYKPRTMKVKNKTPKGIEEIPNYCYGYDLIFIECKVNGYLSKEEKEKARWYLENNYCSKFLIAYKTKEKNRVKVNYKEFEL